jgi:ABC-type multidrug transport system fused ATPase/permease subunit
MVLDAGRLVEFDTPLSLLGKENSFFKHLVDQSADKEALIKLARRE